MHCVFQPTCGMIPVFVVVSCFLLRVSTLVGFCVCLCGRGILPPGTWDISTPVDNHLISHRIRTPVFQPPVARSFCLLESRSTLWPPCALLHELFLFQCLFLLVFSCALIACVSVASLRHIQFACSFSPDSPTPPSASILLSSTRHIQTKASGKPP